MNKSFVSKAVALVMTMGSLSANAVMLDMTGGGGSGLLANGQSAHQNVTSLDWRPDNALAIGALSTPTVAQGAIAIGDQAAGESYVRNVAQGTLAGFGTSAGFFGTEVAPNFFLQGREFTFQASFYTFTAGIGSGSVTNRLAPGESFFRIYADSNLATKSNVVTGVGYGADAGAELVLEGTLSALNGIFQDKTRGEGLGLDLLDDFGADDQNGVRTHQGGGSIKLVTDITYLNSNYFTGNVAQLLMTLVYGDTSNLAAPFITTSPSNSVVGVTPAYSLTPTGAVNGADCSPQLGGVTETGARVPRCDFHFQSDASGSFRDNQLPEPATLGLVGLAFAGAGFAARRRAKNA